MSDEFFDDTTVEDISERHIAQVMRLEDTQADNLVETFTSAKRALLDRLTRARAGSFTEQQLRGTLAQVDIVLSALNQRMLGNFKDSTQILGEAGIEHLITEITKFSKKFLGAVVPLNLDAALIAQNTANFLFNQYESSVKSYTQGLRSRMVQGLTESVISQDSFSATVMKIGQFFSGEEWQVNRIARTELHNMYNKAKMSGMGDVQENTLPDLKKALWHPMDQRTGKDSIALAKQNPIVDIDEPFIQHWKGKKFVFMTPPNRPNDRAILIPYRAAWSKNAG